MTCRYIGNAIVCGPRGPYLYKGIYWEWHSFCGPHPINKKTLEPWKKVPNHVWAIANEFAREPDKEQFLVNT